MSPASTDRDLTGKEGVLKVYNEAELGVQRLRIPGELKDGGEANTLLQVVDRYHMPCRWNKVSLLCLHISHTSWNNVHNRCACQMKCTHSLSIVI